MKTFIILIAAFLLLAVNTYGQWMRNYGLENATYLSVSFYEEFIGFVTSNQNIQKTTDGGLSWSMVDISNPLNSKMYVKMTDKYTIWLLMNRDPILNSGGSISKSEDGGNTWEIKLATNVHSFKKLFFLDETHVWAATGSYLVYRSVDGGETWSVSDQLDMSTIRDLYFIDPGIGWASGGDYRDMIAMTTDGGITWETQFEQYNSSGGNMRIEFVNPQKGFAVGFDRLMLKTLNGGETWEFVSTDANPGILADIPAGYAIFDIEFIDENNGWIAGGGRCEVPGHFIMSTTDGGDSWQVEMLDEFLPFHAINALDFNDSGYGWAIGDNGLLFSKQVLVGVQEASENTKLKIFPNPAQNYVLINSEKDFRTISLYNHLGQMLYSDETVNSKEIKLDLSLYQNGIYFIGIDNTYYKFIKN